MLERWKQPNQVEEKKKKKGKKVKKKKSCSTVLRTEL